MKRLLCFCALFCILICGCKTEETIYKASINQPIENITSIELLDSTDFSNPVVLYTLTEDELQPFLEEFLEIPFLANGPPPGTRYGPLAVRLRYEDGYGDIIGIYANWYISPEDEIMSKSYWYHAQNKSDFYDLFSKYVDSDLLPSLD